MFIIPSSVLNSWSMHQLLSGQEMVAIRYFIASCWFKNTHWHIRTVFFLKNDLQKILHDFLSIPPPMLLWIDSSQQRNIPNAWGEIPVDDGVGKEIVGIAQLKGDYLPSKFVAKHLFAPWTLQKQLANPFKVRVQQMIIKGAVISFWPPTSQHHLWDSHHPK